MCGLLELHGGVYLVRAVRAKALISKEKSRLFRQQTPEKPSVMIGSEVERKTSIQNNGGTRYVQENNGGLW